MEPRVESTPTPKLSSNGHRKHESVEEDYDSDTGHLSNDSRGIKDSGPTNTKYKIELVWRNIFLMILLHSMGIYGLYLLLFQCKWQTMYFNVITLQVLALGVTAGAHRLWSHRSYEARLPLRIFLMILNSAMLQNDIYEWSRDHRVHHKFSETDADPHNAKRGFFFSHVGWLLCRKHKDVFEKGKTVSLADLEKDPVVQFQRQFYKPLAMFFTFYLPAYIPYYFWGENIYHALFISAFRYAFALHGTWLVNSAAHLYGHKLYDQGINPSENRMVQFMSIGEGYHNYHHVFPYDYSASELSWTHDFNVSTLFIDAMAWLGLAYNLKKVDKKVVESRINRTGDRSLLETYRHTKSKGSWVATLWPLVVLNVFLPLAIIGIRYLVALVAGRSPVF